MNPTITIIFLNFLYRLLNRKVKQVNKLLQTIILHLMLNLKNKLTHDILYWRLIHLIKRLVLFFLTILPVVFHLL